MASPSLICKKVISSLKRFSLFVLFLFIITILLAFFWKPLDYFDPLQMVSLGKGHSPSSYISYYLDTSPKDNTRHDNQRTPEKPTNLAVSSQKLTMNVSGVHIGDFKSKVGDVYGTGCPANPKRKVLRRLLSYWVNLSNLCHIDYFICYGSLLGYVRDQDFIPYDHDIDFCMSDKEFYKLQPLGSQKPFDHRERRFRIALQDDLSKDVHHRIRVNCKGHQVTHKSDPCSFVVPWARILYKGLYVDIFVFIERGNHLHDTQYKVAHSRKDVFPVKPCMFMGIRTKCPRNTPAVLSRYYGRNAITRPEMVCRNNTWVSVKVAPYSLA